MIKHQNCLQAGASFFCTITDTPQNMTSGPGPLPRFLCYPTRPSRNSEEPDSPRRTLLGRDGDWRVSRRSFGPEVSETKQRLRAADSWQACLTGAPVRSDRAVGSAGSRCTVRDVQPWPVLSWCRVNRSVDYPSGSMQLSSTAVQSSAARLLQVAAHEGGRSDRISNGNAIPYHLANCS